MSLACDLRALLARVRVLPRRLSLSTPGVQATVPTLRGVWGAALHDLAPEAYADVFEGRGRPHERTPAYVLRPAPPDPSDAPAVEFILIGDAVRHDAAAMRAWDIASGMGLGRSRRRFVVRRARALSPSGEAASPDVPATPWPVSGAAWPLEGDPASTPCRLRFEAPLRIVRDGELVERPALADVAVAALRRVTAFAPAGTRAEARRLARTVAEIARDIPCEPWSGERLDLVRYSARQRVDIELRGVAGVMGLPAGPGELWPLLAAARWLHVGKGTTVGMGQPLMEPGGQERRA